MADTETVEIEEFNEAVNLEDELLDHLAHPESAMAIYRSKFNVNLLNKDEHDGKRMLTYVLNYIVEHGEAPEPDVIIHDFGGGHFSTPRSPVLWLVEKFRERYKRNQAKAAVKKIATLATTDPHLAVRTALQEFGDIQRTASDRNRELVIEDWEDALADYRERVTSGKLHGITFGYEQMDSKLGGIRPNNMVFIVGRPKWYKSWQLLKSAVQAMHDGHRAVFFTLELSEQEMYGRFQCMVAGVGWNNYQHGKMSKEEWKLMHEAGERINDAPGRVDFIHARHDQRTVHELTMEAVQRDAEIVYLDQFRFLTPTRTYEKQNTEMESIVYDIKNIGCSEMPWYVAAQFNREAASLTEMADLAKIGLTDAIGQASDIVFGLYRNKDMAENNILQMGTIATRGFQDGVWELGVQLTKHTNFKLLNEKTAA